MTHKQKVTKTVLFIAIVAFFTSKANAQVSYQYDNNGNRTAKVIVLNSLKSDDFATDDTENDELKFYNDQLGETLVKIFPNPTKGLLRVEVNDKADEDGFIEIINSVGKNICKTSNITRDNQLDLSNQPNGLYMMRIIVNGQTSTWKIIKE